MNLLHAAGHLGSRDNLNDTVEAIFSVRRVVLLIGPGVDPLVSMYAELHWASSQSVKYTFRATV